MSDALEVFESFHRDDSSHWFDSIGRFIHGHEIKATAHPNGFLKFTLREYPDGSKLRLHVWSNAQPANVHDHRWDFAAMVLQGELYETCFLPSGMDNDVSYYRVYSVISGELIDTGRIQSLRLASTNTLAPGSIYTRTSNLLHAVVATQENTVSLVATQRAIDGHRATVLSPVGQIPVDRVVSQQTLSPVAFLQILAGHLGRDSGVEQ